MMSPPEERSSAELISEYARLLWHWAWLLILLATIAGVTAYYITIRETPTYEVSAMAMINVAPNSQDAYYSLYYGQQLGESYATIMTTRPVLDAVAARLGLSYMPAVVDVTPIANTQLLTVNVVDTDPDRAAMIANTLVEVFSEQIKADQAERYADSKQNLRSQLDVLEEQIQATTTDLALVGQEIDENNASLTILLQTSTVGMTQEQLEVHNSSIQQLQSTLQSELSQQAQQQTVLQNYQYSHALLLQSYESIRLAETQASSGILLKDPAVPDDAPIQPQPVRTAALAALVGLVVGAGIVFLIEFLDDSLRDPQEITRKWGIPIIGTILDYNTTNGGELVTEKQPRAPVSEAFRSLRTNMQFASVDAPIRTLVVTSPSPQDGKTLVAANLACVVAQGGRKVVILDADLRRPRVHKIFQLHNRFGLTDQFIRPQEFLDGAIQPSDIKNLYALTSGSLPPNPSELLGSQRMMDILQMLRAQFDLVIMDAPPALIVTDANVLANQADGVLLVLRPSITKRTAIYQALDQLAQVKANVVGIVLNDLNAKSYRYNYYRNYYHKYGQGYAYYTESTPKKEGRLAKLKAKN